MEKQKSALPNSTNSEKGMYEFFHQEFQTLKAKTGIKQWEHLNEQPNAAKGIHEVIEFMCQECIKPPFHVVQPIIKQRVISRAIVEDIDFIGLNAKFVRRALNAWWTVNGDRVMEAMNQKESSAYSRVELTEAQKRKIDRIANKYVAEILQGEGPKMIPKIQPEAVKKEGAEWQSNLERKAVCYPITTISQAHKHELHLEWCRCNFDKYTADKLPTWKPEQEWIESLSETEKERIYKAAIK